MERNSFWFIRKIDIKVKICKLCDLFKLHENELRYGATKLISVFKIFNVSYWKFVCISGVYIKSIEMNKVKVVLENEKWKFAVCDCFIGYFL